MIRLGVTDASKIADFLSYSVNTIHTYKTRAKKRSLLPNDRFEEAIMEIRTISYPSHYQAVTSPGGARDTDQQQS